MKIYDFRKNLIQYTDKRLTDFDEEKLERLDQMLNEYHVDHMFALPTEDDVKANDKNGDTEMTVYFMVEDEMTFDLVYLLWCRTYRGATNKQIAENAWKITKHWNEQNNGSDQVEIL